MPSLGSWPDRRKAPALRPAPAPPDDRGWRWLELLESPPLKARCRSDADFSRKLALRGPGEAQGWRSRVRSRFPRVAQGACPSAPEATRRWRRGADVAAMRIALGKLVRSVAATKAVQPIGGAEGDPLRGGRGGSERQLLLGLGSGVGEARAAGHRRPGRGTVRRASLSRVVGRGGCPA